MKKLLMFICVLTFSCGKVDLLPTTASEINQKIRSYKGNKVVLLNIWALWCVPCVEEFPMIVDLDKEIEELRKKADNLEKLLDMTRRTIDHDRSMLNKPKGHLFGEMM